MGIEFSCIGTSDCQTDLFASFKSPVGGGNAPNSVQSEEVSVQSNRYMIMII